MAAERLAVVDGRDRVVGYATRAEVHARGLRHRAVHVLVSRDDGAVYVQRRAEHKDCAPGLWDTWMHKRVTVSIDHDPQHCT
ncbi:MAG: NUDIX hydrolase, partial [Gammaproteobacteria bacterium]